MFSLGWVKYAVLLVAVTGAIGYVYHKGDLSGSERVQIAWDKNLRDIAAEQAKQAAAFAATQAEWQQRVDDERRVADAKLSDLKNKYDGTVALVNRLRSDNGSISAKLNALSRTSAEACNGVVSIYDRQYSELAGALAEASRRADEAGTAANALNNSWPEGRKGTK